MRIVLGSLIVKMSSTIQQIALMDNGHQKRNKYSVFFCVYKSALSLVSFFYIQVIVVH